MRLENTWQEIRDHSFIQNHSRSFRFTAPWWCVFSSVHFTHFLQGSGLRTGMAKAESWFCAQWPIFMLFLRFVFGLLSGCTIQTWPIIRFNRVSHLLIFFYLLVFNTISDAIYLNKIVYVCLHAHALKNHLTLFPSQLLDLRCFFLLMYSIHLKHSYSL